MDKSKFEELFPTLDQVNNEFTYGSKNYSWRSRHDSVYHRISATKEWYRYRTYLRAYPGKVGYDSHWWSVLDIGCGKRGRQDTLLLIRPVELLDILKRFEVSHIDEISGWNLRNYARDDNGNLYAHEKVPITYFVEDWSSCYDKSFKNWHLDSQIKGKEVHEEKASESEVKDMACISGCRPSYCYCKKECDDKNLKYEINEHSMEVEVTIGYRSFSLSLDESAELASFLLSAKDKIKEKKIAALEQQQEDLKKQLENVKNL